MSIVDSTVSASPVQAHNIVGRLRRGKVAIKDDSLSHLIFATFRFAVPEIEIVSASALLKSHSKPLIARRCNFPANGTVSKAVIN
jgi:hypothetical protein